MSRFTLQMLASLGVVTALAVFDLGPCASAAYISTVSQSATASTLVTSVPVDSPDNRRYLHIDKVHLALFHLEGGGMSSSGSTTSGGESQTVGLLIPPVPSNGASSEYLRERSNRLPPCYLIDTLLDPPRLI